MRSDTWNYDQQNIYFCLQCSSHADWVLHFRAISAGPQSILLHDIKASKLFNYYAQTGQRLEEYWLKFLPNSESSLLSKNSLEPTLYNDKLNHSLKWKWAKMCSTCSFRKERMFIVRAGCKGVIWYHVEIAYNA